MFDDIASKQRLAYSQKEQCTTSMPTTRLVTGWKWLICMLLFHAPTGAKQRGTRFVESCDHLASANPKPSMYQFMGPGTCGCFCGASSAPCCGAHDCAQSTLAHDRSADLLYTNITCTPTSQCDAAACNAFCAERRASRLRPALGCIDVTALSSSVQWRKHSQFYQDSVLDTLFIQLGKSKRGTFVEFGSPQELVRDRSGTDCTGMNTDPMSNTIMLQQRGWTGLVMDGGARDWGDGSFEAGAPPGTVQMRRAFITAASIVPLFAAHRVPTDLDLLSIDVDSCDMWIFLNLTASGYRPKVVLIEANPFFSAKEAVSLACGKVGGDGSPPEPDPVFKTAGVKMPSSWSSFVWSHLGLYSASHKAMRLAARARGYTPVMLDSVACEDIFFVRDDLLCHTSGAQRVHLRALRTRFERLPWPACKPWMNLSNHRLSTGNREHVRAKYTTDVDKWMAA